MCGGDFQTRTRWWTTWWAPVYLLAHLLNLTRSPQVNTQSSRTHKRGLGNYAGVGSSCCVWQCVKKKNWNSFPLEYLECLECPDLMCKPQCVPAEKDRYVSMFPLSGKLYPSVLKHVYERTCVHLHTLVIFFSHLSTNLRSSHLLFTPSTSLSATQSLFHVTQRSRRMKPLSFFFSLSP